MADTMEIIVSAVDQASEIFESIINSITGMGSSVEQAFEEASAEVERLTEELAQIEMGELEGDFDAVAQQLAEAEAEAERLKEAMEEVDEATKETGDDLDIINSAMFMQLGEQVGQLGSQAEGMAQDMNTAAISVGQLATNAGIAEPQMISLINNISNATFPQNEAMAYVQALNQMGVSADKLGDSATNMDRINDATGIGYTKVMQLTQGLQAVGISADNLPSSFNAIAYAQANVNGGADTLSTVLKRQAATINEYGLNVDQLVIIMQKLSERGVQGMKMGSELSKVLKENNGDIQAIEQSLGLETGALSNATAKTGEYEGQLQSLADEEMEHKTILDQLGAAWEDVTLSVGQFMTPFLSVVGLIGSVGSFGLQIKGLKELSSLTKSLTEIEIIESAVQSGKAAIMSVVTAATTIYSAVVGVLTGEIGLVTAATTIWNAVLAMNPIMLVVIAIIALIAVIYEVGKAFGWWTDVGSMIDAIWAGIQRLWSAFINHPDVQAAIQAITGALQWLWGAIQNAGQAILEFFGISTGGDFDVVRALIDGIGAAWDAIKAPIQFVIELFTAAGEAGNATADAFEEFWNGTLAPFGEWLSGIFAPVWDLLAQVFSMIVPYVQALTAAFGQFMSGQMDLPSLVMTVLTLLFTAYSTIFSMIVSRVTSWGQSILSKGISAASNFVMGIVNRITALPGRIYSLLLSVVSRIISAIQSWINAAVAKVRDLISKITSPFSGVASAISNGLAGVVSAITSPFTKAWDILSPVLNNIKNGIDTITSLGGLFAGGDIAPGGDIASSSTIISENNPVEVEHNLNITLDLQNVPGHISTSQLITALTDRNVLRELTSNDDFQLLDSQAKERLNLKINRARGL